MTSHESLFVLLSEFSDYFHCAFSKNFTHSSTVTHRILQRKLRKVDLLFCSSQATALFNLLWQKSKPDFY